MKILKILEERLSETSCPSFFIQELFAVDSGYKASFKYSLLDKFIPSFHPLPYSMPQFQAQFSLYAIASSENTSENEINVTETY